MLRALTRSKILLRAPTVRQDLTPRLHHLRVAQSVFRDISWLRQGLRLVRHAPLVLIALPPVLQQCRALALRARSRWLLHLFAQAV